MGHRGIESMKMRVLFETRGNAGGITGGGAGI